MVITKDLVFKARKVYVMMSFTGHDSSWVRVSKEEMYLHLPNVPNITGEWRDVPGFMKDGKPIQDLYICREE